MTLPWLNALFQLVLLEGYQNNAISNAGHTQIFNGVSIWAINTPEKWMAK